MNTTLSDAKIELHGVQTLRELQVMLAAKGVELVLTGDAGLSIYGRGELFVHEMPALITNQTSLTVIQYGARWLAVDLGDAVPIADADPAHGGFKSVNKDDATEQHLIDQLAASRPVYTVEVAVWEADCRIAYPLNAAQLTAGVTIATATCTAGELFEFKDVRTQFIQQTVSTGVGASPLFQSGQTTRDAGLVVAGKVRQLPGVLEIRGKFSLSSSIGQDQQVEKSTTINILTSPEEWTTLATLRNADAAIALKPFGVSLGGGAYDIRLRCRVARLPSFMAQR